MRSTALKIVVVVAALLLPLAAAVVATGSLPRSLAPADLDAWSPIRSPGPSATLLARGLVALAGVGETSEPDWFTPDDRQLLDAAEAALRADKLQEAMGQLTVLSGRLQDRGKTFHDFLPLVMPDVATYVVASYLAPLLLGLLGLGVVLVLFAPWLIARLYDLLKLVTTLALAVAALVGLALLGLALSGERALVYGLIEYLVAVALLIILGNAIVFAMTWRRRRFARGDGRGGRLSPPL